MQVLYELPTSSQWCFDIQWCPRNPAVLSAASFSGHIDIYSIMGGSNQAQSERQADQVRVNLFRQKHVSALKRQFVFDGLYNTTFSVQPFWHFNGKGCIIRFSEEMTDISHFQTWPPEIATEFDPNFLLSFPFTRKQYSRRFSFQMG